VASSLSTFALPRISRLFIAPEQSYSGKISQLMHRPRASYPPSKYSPGIKTPFHTGNFSPRLIDDGFCSLARSQSTNLCWMIKIRSLIFRFARSHSTRACFTFFLLQHEKRQRILQTKSSSGLILERDVIRNIS
jgi:hypothetical protein